MASFVWGRWMFTMLIAAVLSAAMFGCRRGRVRCYGKRKLKRVCLDKCRAWARTGEVSVGGPRFEKVPVKVPERYRSDGVRKLIRDLRRSGWSSTIVFLDPRHGNDVWMRIAVKPSTTACVSNDESKRITTVPIPPHAQLTACGKKDGKMRWFEHSRGVGVVEIHRGNRRKKPHFRISWRNMRGNVRVFSQTFVLPEEYEWEARDMREVINFDRKPVDVNWKRRRHNILSMTVHNVHRIRGRLRFRLRKTPLETELLQAYKDCPGCIQRTAEGVTVRLPMKVLFASGKAKLAPAGQRLLKQFLGVLQKHVSMGRTIAVVGHTDNLPIKTRLFASNWELSTQRACAVTRFFVKGGLPSRFFKAVGHAGNRPVASNDTAEGRGRNRRVELFFETRPTATVSPVPPRPAARPAGRPAPRAR